MPTPKPSTGLYMIVERGNWNLGRQARVKLRCATTNGLVVDVEDCEVDELMIIDYVHFMAAEAMMDRQKKACNIRPLIVPNIEAVTVQFDYGKLEMKVMAAFGVPKEVVGADVSR